MLKIAIITTVNHNVGDDFVREGLKYILKKHFGKSLLFENIHKHSPITTRRGFEWFRYNGIASRVDRLLPLSISNDRLLEADIVVQSGAPVYWHHEIGGGHCADNEWYTPLIRRRFLKNKNAKLLNLAGGTCQKYHSDGSEFLNCDKCKKYIKEFFNESDVTTVRDSLGRFVLNGYGLDAPVIPCSSIFATDEYNLKSQKDEYVVVNFMEGGAHYTFGQKVDFMKWKREFSKFYFNIKKKYKVVFSCHNKKECSEAKKIDPNAEIFFQKNDFLSYMKFYSRAKFGIVNRVHAAFLIASYGNPSLIIGNDSRAKMAAEIGLENYYVNDVDSDLLLEKTEELESYSNTFKEIFGVIKNKAYQDYMTALQNIDF